MIYSRTCKGCKLRFTPKRPYQIFHNATCCTRWHRKHPKIRVEYSIYQGARQRCTNPKRPNWRIYGGRGIQFKFTNFEQWFAELGPRPSAKYSVDRIDTDGDYTPGNVRWATGRQQQQNRRRNRKKSA